MDEQIRKENIDDRLFEIAQEEILKTDWPKMSDNAFDLAKLECFFRIDERAIEEGVLVPIREVIEYIVRFRMVYEDMFDRTMEIFESETEGENAKA